MNWPIKPISIGEIFLDQKNIRTPINDNDQSALIQDMFINEDAFELVKSYVQNDTFPDEFPIIIYEEGRPIVIEGNRRLAALKAILEPDLVPTFKSRIKSLKATSITEINVVVAPDRDAAIKHIANKHTINYRRPWKPLREAYFYKSQLDNGKSVKQLIEEYPEHDVVRFIKMLEAHHLAKSIKYDNIKVNEIIHDERKFPITNLERFYDDKSVTDFLGINFTEEGRIKGNIIKEEFKKGYKKLIEDTAIGIIDSRKYNTKQEREEYVNKFPKEIVPDKSKKGSFDGKDFTEVKQSVEQEKKKSKGTKTKPIPKGLFFASDVPFNISNTSLKFIYDELRNISVQSFPNATHDLLRSFLECSLVSYLKETGEYSKVEKNDKHNPKLDEMLKFISSDKCNSITDTNLKQAIEHIRSQYSQPYSLARMNMIQHNENWNSTERDARATWGRMERLIKLLLSPVK